MDLTMYIVAKTRVMAHMALIDNSVTEVYHLKAHCTTPPNDNITSSNFSKIIFIGSEEEKNPSNIYVYFPDPSDNIHNKYIREALPVPESTKVLTGPWCSTLASIELHKAEIGYGIKNFYQCNGSHSIDLNDMEFLGLDNFGFYREFISGKDALNHINSVIAEPKEEQPVWEYIIAKDMLEKITEQYPDKNDEIGCMFFMKS